LEKLKISVHPIENKRRHNRGMRNLRQLVINHGIDLDIEFIGGRVVN